MNKEDKGKLRKNFSLLSDDLIVSEKFLALLIECDCITMQQFEELIAEKERKRTSPFLMLIQKRGPKAFGQFLTALMETGQGHIAESMDKEFANNWKREQGSGDAAGAIGAAPCSQRPAGSHGSVQEIGHPSSSALEISNVDYGEPLVPEPSLPAVPAHKPFVFNPIGIEPSTGHDSQFIVPTVPKLNPQDPWVQAKLKDHHVYPMNQKPRGRVVVVNNEIFSFQIDSGDREGSNFDAVNLSQLFEHLDYKVDIWKDYTAKDLMDRVKEEAKHEAHSKANAFIMFIMSHGVRGYVYGVDGEKLLISDIVTQFNSKNCPSLNGKPKLFFIQACQGVEKEGDDVDGDTCSSDAELPGELAGRLSDLRLKDDDSKVPITLPEGPPDGGEMADIHIVYSTAPGHLSWRNSELGTWFIREFILVCNDIGHKEDIREILRRVRIGVKARLLAKGLGQIPPSVDYLEKKFYFLPGV